MAEDLLGSVAQHHPTTAFPMPSELRSEHLGNALVLNFSSSGKPEFSAEMLSACVEALNVAAGMAEARAVLLHGVGAAFFSDPPLPSIEPALSQLVDAIRTCPQPVVAVLDGSVSGAAASLVWACDLVVASAGTAAVLCQDPRVEPLAGLLPRQLVQQLTWFAEPLPAERLQQLGLVNWISAPGQALAQALQVVERLQDQPSAALALSKERLSETTASTGVAA